MAPRRRGNAKRVGLSRMGAAIVAMTEMGFQPATRIRKKVRELLKVYGGDDGWFFIEDGSYNVLVEALLGGDNDDSGPLLLKDAASEHVAETSNMGEGALSSFTRRNNSSGAASNQVSGDTQMGTFMAFEANLTEDENATPTLMEPVIPSSSRNIGENQMDSGETHMGDSSLICADIRRKAKQVVLSSSHCKSGEIHMGNSSRTESYPPKTKPVLHPPDQGMGLAEVCSAVKAEYMEEETPVIKPLQLCLYDQGLGEIPPSPNRHMIKSVVPPPPLPPVCSAVCDQVKSSSSPQERKRSYGWIGCDENDYVLLEAMGVKGKRQRGRRYKRGEVKWDVKELQKFFFSY